MKKFLSLAVAVLFVSSSAFAATTSTVYLGIADFSNSGVADFHFNLKNVSGDSAVSNNTIAWTNPDAFNTTDADKWVRADQYAEVIANVTKAGFNVYMYQNNGQSTSGYKAVEPRVNADNSKPISGLVREGSNGGAFRGYVPLAYSFVPTKNASITFDGTVATGEDRADRFFVDQGDKKADGTSSFDKNYSLIASLCGPVFGPFDKDGNLAPWCSPDVVNKTAYMYFFGNFQNIIGGDKFGTDQIIVEQVTL